MLVGIVDLFGQTVAHVVVSVLDVLSAGVFCVFQPAGLKVLKLCLLVAVLVLDQQQPAVVIVGVGILE